MSAAARGSAAAVRLAVIGAIVLAVIAAFGAVGGWFSPGRLTRGALLAGLQGPNPKEPGFRRNHAKGMCASGWFDSTGSAREISRAALFQPGKVRVIARFGLAGYLPFQPDKPGTSRSLALQFLPQGGGEWRTGMVNIPVFVVNSAQGFLDFVVATTPDPATGAPVPAHMAAFAAKHPETMKALGIVTAAPPTQGFGDTVFRALDSFRFTNAAGHTVAVRWAVVPDPGQAPPAIGTGVNYLFTDVARQIAARPLRWHLMLTVADPSDQTADPTLPWPAGRRTIDAGVVTLDRVFAEADGPCMDINYDPLVLPDGMAPSDDPIPSARSSTYARSFTLRAGERAVGGCHAVRQHQW